MRWTKHEKSEVSETWGMSGPARRAKYYRECAEKYFDLSEAPDVEEAIKRNYRTIAENYIKQAEIEDRSIDQRA